MDKHARPAELESVPLADALGRFLTTSIDTPIDIPPFSKSAMDGYAVRGADLESDPARSLPVAGVIAAGGGAPPALEPGSAAQIMTGAPIPEGADRVIRVEYATREGDTVAFGRLDGSSNIIYRGENARKGEAILTPRRLGVHDIGVAASVGLDVLPVAKQPRLAVLSTGDELVEPGASLETGRIYNSNAYQLLAHARRAGFLPIYGGIAADDESALYDRLSSVLESADVVVLSGGVSKGEFDYVPRVLASLDVREVFHRVAMKPGRPLYFGIRDTGAGGRQYLFGLPGNPVSVFVTFELFAVRLLYRLAGLDPPGPTLALTLATTLQKGDPERTEFVPVAVRNGLAEPVRYGGSSHLNALSRADALVELPIGTTEIKEGTVIHARPL